MSNLSKVVRIKDLVNEKTMLAEFRYDKAGIYNSKFGLGYYFMNFTRREVLFINGNTLAGRDLEKYNVEGTSGVIGFEGIKTKNNRIAIRVVKLEYDAKRQTELTA